MLYRNFKSVFFLRKYFFSVKRNDLYEIFLCIKNGKITTVNLRLSGCTVNGVNFPPCVTVAGVQVLDRYSGRPPRNRYHQIV